MPKTTTAGVTRRNEPGPEQGEVRSRRVVRVASGLVLAGSLVIIAPSGAMSPVSASVLRPLLGHGGHTTRTHGSPGAKPQGGPTVTTVPSRFPPRH
jgi:hypothetical protein